MYLDYLKERYTEADVAPLTLEQVAEKFEEIYKHGGSQILKTPQGFATYELVGDALIINDLYVKAGCRRTGEAWRIHNLLVDLARTKGKRVAITFSEKYGKKHFLGLAAIHAAGFHPSHELDNGLMFIKGI